MVLKASRHFDYKIFSFDGIASDELRDVTIYDLVCGLMIKNGEHVEDIFEIKIMDESYCDYADEFTLDVLVSWYWISEEEIDYI